MSAKGTNCIWKHAVFFFIYKMVVYNVKFPNSKMMYNVRGSDLCTDIFKIITSNWNFLEVLFVLNFTMCVLRNKRYARNIYLCYGKLDVQFRELCSIILVYIGPHAFYITISFEGLGLFYFLFFYFYFFEEWSNLEKKCHLNLFWNRGQWLRT